MGQTVWRTPIEMHRDNSEIPVFTMPLLRKRRYWEWDIDILNGGMHCREVGSHLKVYSSIIHVVCPRIFFQDFGRTKSSPHLLWPWVHRVNKCWLPSNLDTNYMHSSFLSKVLLITEDEDVNDMYMKIKELMTFCMTLKTMIMVTRTKLLFVADIHTYACTYSIYNEHNYTCRTQLLWFSLSSFMHTNNIQTWRFVHACIIAHVYSQWWYCADRIWQFKQWYMLTATI